MNTENERERAQLERPTDTSAGGRLSILVGEVDPLAGGFAVRGLRLATEEDLAALGYRRKGKKGSKA